MKALAKRPPETPRIRASDGQPLRLDLGCGDNKAAGHIGIDAVKTAAADHVLDLTQTPWPIDAAAVDSIYCSHFFEHLTGAQRMAFMDECWRILKPGAQLAIIVPHWSSMRAVQDPTHQWPPVAETSFLYFNKTWREQNKLAHYAIACDFDFGYGHAVDPDIAVLCREAQDFRKNSTSTPFSICT
jgi:SAM-dependent methyltransferase